MRAGAPTSKAAAASARSSAAAAVPSPRLGRGRRSAVAVAAAASREVTLLDYGAGNVRSVRNAIKRLGWTIKDVSLWFMSPLGRVSAAPRRAATKTATHSSPF
jgi:hypothetical protein